MYLLEHTNLKTNPPQIIQHQIKLDTIVPPARRTKYWLNPNYAIIFKQDIDKLLATSFIKLVEEATQLPPIMVVLKKNIGKSRLCVDFKKLNATTKDLYPLPFTYEVINIVVGHKVYTFLDEF